MGVLDEFRLDGSVALVTGAAGGLGSAFATAMAEAGADVVVADLDHDGAQAVADDLEADTGAETLALEVDVTDEAAVEGMVDAALERFGRLDAAFANAGIGELERPAQHYQLAQWDRIVDVNLRGVWLTDLYAARAMAEQDSGGSIVNTASVYGLVGSDAMGYNPAYAASKGGVVNLTRTLGAEWAPEIRVNAIAPSHARTNIGGGYLDEDSRVGQDIADEIEAETPVDRIAEPEELQGMALFLASEAARYCTGYTYAVDGGWLAR
ncbi:SDR family NAD(P)-dependent oxidoreductase [Halorientalis pallida]|uniref:SDR family oxidoreductase n=1 Tax=Halorientalis pallida TaxID=2479928 RepID=A0A498L6W0_9EURY|nr:SDR family NAD(P)-dependent oxidoreductase [Halorientalis pallida]RXK50445.1 SDR family oxidoreductase [Halorientalis pallida]